MRRRPQEPSEAASGFDVIGGVLGLGAVFGMAAQWFTLNFRLGGPEPVPDSGQVVRYWLTVSVAVIICATGIVRSARTRRSVPLASHIVLLGIAIVAALIFAIPSIHWPPPAHQGTNQSCNPGIPDNCPGG